MANQLKFSELEPVRLIGWLNAIIITAASILNQVQTSFDSHSGWMGFAFAVMIAVGTEVQRDKVTPVAKLQQEVPVTE